MGSRLSIVAGLDMPTAGLVDTGGRRVAIMFQEPALFKALTAPAPSAPTKPEPVGAAMSVCRFSRIAAQPRCWTVVGVPRVSENQRSMTGWKGI